ncbi:BnaCnng29710D [Brassica napus]|uniref:tryptophan synthase n=1 Tax=Brassica napus TaxID=3708 RepID=A0A078IZI3_BRANA|nr:BnaCnng29710D [Brassica napus]
MPLHLCLRHCVSNYSACVSSFMFWESRNTRNAVISWASTCSSSIISTQVSQIEIKVWIFSPSVWGRRGSSLRQELVNTVLLTATVHGEASPQCLQNATSWCRGERSSLWNSHIEGRDIRSDKRLGSVAGPHPYPMMVRDFHAVIGKETRRQALEKWGGKPDVLVACVGGGSNAMGLFHEFVDDAEVRMIGVEAAGFGLDSGKHAAPLTKGDVGVLHGAMSYLLQDDDGQIIEPQLDYPGVGPEHTLEAFNRVSRLEGIISALETSHALAHLEKLCPTLPDGARVVLNFSGRGDKDDQTVAKYLEV